MLPETFMNERIEFNPQKNILGFCIERDRTGARKHLHALRRNILN
jgi:hypothetical protein